MNVIRRMHALWVVLGVATWALGALSAALALPPLRG
jgi:hypothetical protein